MTHHTKTYGRRYHVDGEHRHLVTDLVEEGKQRIMSWMGSNGVGQDAIRRFKNDKFDHSQDQSADSRLLGKNGGKKG